MQRGELGWLPLGRVVGLRWIDPLCRSRACLSASVPTPLDPLFLSNSVSASVCLAVPSLARREACVLVCFTFAFGGELGWRSFSDCHRVPRPHRCRRLVYSALAALGRCFNSAQCSRDLQNTKVGLFETLSVVRNCLVVGLKQGLNPPLFEGTTMYPSLKIDAVDELVLMIM